MTLDRRLYTALLSHQCPTCGHVMQKTGQWFKFSRHYSCPQCQTLVRLPYETKLKLFDRHLRVERQNQ